MGQNFDQANDDTFWPMPNILTRNQYFQAEWKVDLTENFWIFVRVDFLQNLWVIRINIWLKKVSDPILHLLWLVESAIY